MEVTIKAVIDSREANEAKHILERLEEEGFDTIVLKLDAGDYLLNGNILVERSSVTDFANKISSGRIWKQAKKMAKSNAENLRIVIEGSLASIAGGIGLDIVKETKKAVLADYGDGKAWLPKSKVKVKGDRVTYVPSWLKNKKGIPREGNWNRSSLMGVVNSLQTSYEITVDVIPSSDWTPEYLKCLAKERSDKVSPLRVDTKAENPDARSRMLVEGLPGIGGEMAIRLLEHFGTAFGVFGASEGELMEVKGVGEATASDIKESLEHGYSE